MARLRKRESSRNRFGAPYLRGITSTFDNNDRSQYPFNIPAFVNGINLDFKTNVTFLVGENGSGKSTLLEALAECCGFNPEGGNRDHHRESFTDRSEIAQAIRLSWLPKVSEGFFMRAESFYNFATYLGLAEKVVSRICSFSRGQQDHSRHSGFDPARTSVTEIHLHRAPLG
ncbi:MAG: AAA family ATPase [Nitrospirota bacterium]|nr:AAA family ATPase [Nitrospirota bacterium]